MGSIGHRESIAIERHFQLDRFEEVLPATREDRQTARGSLQLTSNIVFDALNVALEAFSFSRSFRERLDTLA
jgi:hypothetical protein